MCDFLRREAGNEGRKAGGGDRGISILETALMLVPLLLFLVGVIGIIDFIRVGHIVSRTQDEYLRSLNGRPYRFAGGAIVFDRTTVDQGIEKIVTGAFEALGNQICGSDTGCVAGVGVEAAVQQLTINPTDGSVQSSATITTLPAWKKGAAVDVDQAGLFDTFRQQTSMLGMPSGLLGNAFLPTTILVSVAITFTYQGASITQQAFNLLGLGVAKQSSAQIMLLRGEIE